MSKAEQLANRCLQERGYLVVTHPLSKPPKLIREVLPRIFGEMPLDHPLVIISETNAADYISQQELLGRPTSKSLLHAYIFYRVTAE